MERGFTIIEVLIVMAMIFILAAIAIPQFASYRAQSFDKRAQAQLRTVALAEEAYFLDNDTYVDCTHVDCSTKLPGVGGQDAGVLLQITSTASGFTGTALHIQGTGKIFSWN